MPALFERPKAHPWGGGAQCMQQQRPSSSRPPASRLVAAALRMFAFVVFAVAIHHVSANVPPFTFAAAAPTVYCLAGGPPMTNTTIAPSTTGAWVGNGCTLGAGSLLEISGANAPLLSATPAGSTVDVRFTNGVVLPQGHISINGPQSSAAATMVPFVVVVSGNTFGNASAVLITGSFPPDSNITVSFNTFVSSGRCNLMTRITVNFVSAVAIADAVPIVLFPRAEVGVRYNNISTVSHFTVHSIPFVVSAITFHKGSRVAISGNTARSHGSGNVWAPGDVGRTGNTWLLLFQFNLYVAGAPPNCTFTYIDGGAWAFDDNWMMVSTAISYQARVGNNPSRIYAPNGGSFSISGNFLRALPSPDFMYDANPTYAGDGGHTVANFTHRFENNVIEGNIVPHVMSTLAFVASGASLLTIANNTFISVGASASNSLTINANALSGSSRFLIHGNSFVTLVGATRKSHSITFAAGMTMTDATHLSVARNAVSAPVSNTALKLIVMAAPVTIASGSAVTVEECNNRYYTIPLGWRFVPLLAPAVDANFLMLPIQRCALTASIVPETASATFTASATYSASLAETASASAIASSSLSAAYSQTATLTASFEGARSQTVSESAQPTASSSAHLTSSWSGDRSATASVGPSRRSPSATWGTPSLESTETAPNERTDTVPPTATFGPTGSQSSSLSIGSGTATSLVAATRTASASNTLAKTTTDNEHGTVTGHQPPPPTASASASLSPRRTATRPLETPPVVVNNAANTTIRDLIETIASSQSAPFFLFTAGTSVTPCRRLEQLLLGTSVLAPILAPEGRRGGVGGALFDRRSYGDALATSGLVLLAAAAAGLVVLFVTAAIRRRGVKAAAVAARFPSTCIQCLIFLSPGAAVASGLSAADDAKPAAVGIAILIVAPLCWAAIVLAMAPSEGVVLSVAAANGGCKGRTDDDPIESPTDGVAIGGCLGGRALLCGAVRPASLAATMGPVVADLGGCYPRANNANDSSQKSQSPHPQPARRLGAALRSLLPTVLPWALLASALVVRSVRACEHMPIVAAGLVALYALFVAGLRPFTGHSHNAFEALWSLVAAGLLLWLWLAFTPSADADAEWWAEPRWADAFSPSERAAALCLGGLLSCRYPFVLARALGVGVPRVVATERCSHILPSTAAAYAVAGSRTSNPVLAIVTVADPEDAAMLATNIPANLGANEVGEEAADNAVGPLATPSTATSLTSTPPGSNVMLRSLPSTPTPNGSEEALARSASYVSADGQFEPEMELL